MIDCDNIKELRKIAKEYYKVNIADTEIINRDIGNIKFISKGYKKPLSCSADIRKLLLFPLLTEIVENGILIETKKDRKERCNVEVWFTLESFITIEYEVLRIRTSIRKDNIGKVFYDFVICN